MEVSHVASGDLYVVYQRSKPVRLVGVRVQRYFRLLPATSVDAADIGSRLIER